MNFLLGVTTVTPASIAQASGTAAPLMPAVPLKWFGIMFLVILVGFLVWYGFARRR